MLAFHALAIDCLQTRAKREAPRQPRRLLASNPDVRFFPLVTVVVNHVIVQGYEPGVEGTGSGGGLRAQTWFDVAHAVGDALVPDRADWVVLHVRERVLRLMRAGKPTSLAQAGIGDPRPGEGLSLVALRHRDGDLEVQLNRVIQALHPTVGDPYGSGRVTQTGVSRLASPVDHSHLRAIATDEDNLRMLEKLDLGAAVIAPVVAAGFVIGALNLVHSPGRTAPRDDLEVAENLGLSIGAALDASRPATALAARQATRTHEHVRWTPPAGGNPVAEARRWVRRTLPELLDRPARADLGEDLDLVVSELTSNALRHAGALGDISLGLRDQVVRVAVCDLQDRPPTLRSPRSDQDSGRGLLLVDALTRQWSVDHHVEPRGKSVWAELDI